MLKQFKGVKHVADSQGGANLVLYTKGLNASPTFTFGYKSKK